MIILLKLILAHLVGDFLLQPVSWIREKEEAKVKAPELYFHVLIHGALVLLFLWNFAYWPVALAIMLSHYVIDVLKLYLQKDSNKTVWFWTDQIAHIIILVIIFGAWLRPQWDTGLWTISPAFWIYATALVFITAVAGVVTQKIMQQWSDEIQDSGDQSLESAGKYIGILERLFVFVFIVAGHWGPIGFLLASKSVFRFGDLKEAKDRKLTEYILIGTLLSFGMAIATGIVVRYLMEN